MSGTLTRKVKVVRETTETIYYEQVSDSNLSEKITESETKKNVVLKTNSEEFLPVASENNQQAQEDLQMEFKESTPTVGCGLSKLDKTVSESLSGTSQPLPFKTSSTPIRPVVAPKPLNYLRKRGSGEVQMAMSWNSDTCDKSTQPTDGISSSRDGHNGASGTLPRMAPSDRVNTTILKEVINAPPPPPPLPTYSQTSSKLYEQSPKPFNSTLNSHPYLTSPKPFMSNSLNTFPKSNSFTYKQGTKNTLNIKKKEGEVSDSDTNGNQKSPNQLSDDTNKMENKLQVKSEENYASQSNSLKPQWAMNVDVISLRKQTSGDQKSLSKPFGDKVGVPDWKKDNIDKSNSKSEVSSEDGDSISKASCTEATENKSHLFEKKNVMLIRNQFENKFNSLNQSDTVERKHSTKTVNSTYRNSLNSLDTDVKRIFSTKDPARRYTIVSQSVNKGVPHISREAAAKIEQDLLKVSTLGGGRVVPSSQSHGCHEQHGQGLASMASQATCHGLSGPGTSHCSEQFYSSTLSTVHATVDSRQQSLRTLDAKSFTSNTRLTESRWSGEGFSNQQNIMREQVTWQFSDHQPQLPFNW